MRVDELTTLRFFAAAIVVVFHFGRNIDELSWLSVSGPEMVTFFFVLSGFVLGLSHLGKPLHYRVFAVARIARIVPVYLFSLALMSAAILLKHKTIDPLSFLLNLSFLQAWLPPYPLTINPAAWSLSVEAFFYALFPLLIVAARHWRLSAKSALVLALLSWAAVQIGLSVALRTAYSGYPSSSHDLIYYFPLFHLPSFLLGIAGAMWFRSLKHYINSNIGSIAVVFTTCLIVAVALHFQYDFASLLKLHTGFSSGFLAPVFLLLILAVAVSRSKAISILRYRPLLLLGEASFSFYILQFPVYALYMRFISGNLQVGPFYDFMLFFTALALVSIASYRYLEMPASKAILQRFRR